MTRLAWTHRDIPVSASRVLRLKAWIARPASALSLGLTFCEYELKAGCSRRPAMVSCFCLFVITYEETLYSGVESITGNKLY